MALFILLARAGARVLLLEKSPVLTDHPQAHFINNRSMEVFRAMGGLDAAVLAHSPPLDQWRRFIYCRSLSRADVLGVVDHFAEEAHASEDIILSDDAASGDAGVRDDGTRAPGRLRCAS